MKKGTRRSLLLPFTLWFCLLCLPFPAEAEEVIRIEDPELRRAFALNLQQLGEVVYSASRTPVPFRYAPAVMDVVTRAEIEEQGLTTLKQVLERYGFYSGPTQRWDILGYRGVIQDQNVNVLVLLDGRSLNNDLKGGFGQMHLLPLLDKVDRIEIVRSPCSTLWGDKAFMGVVNMITRQEDGVRASADWDDRANMRKLNLNGGQSGKFGKLRGDFTILESGKTNLELDGPTGTGLRPIAEMNNLEYHKPSHELYLVYENGGVTAKFFKSSLWNGSPDFQNRPKIDREANENVSNIGGDLSYAWRVSAPVTLTTTATYNQFNLDQERQDKGVWSGRRNWEEKTAKIEEVLRWEATGGSTVLAGIDYSYTDWSATQTMFNLATFDYIPGGNHEKYSLFANGTWAPSETWRVSGGARVSKDTLFSGETFMPSLSVQYLPTPSLDLLYAFSTGYVQPTLEQARGGGVIFVDNFNFGTQKYQKSVSHNLKVHVNQGAFDASANFFLINIDGLINFQNTSVPATSTMIPYRVLHNNVGDVETYGVELEGKYNFERHTTVYTNISLSRASFASLTTSSPADGSPMSVSGKPFVADDRTPTGIPFRIYNLGATHRFGDGWSANLHWRRTEGAKTMTQTGSAPLWVTLPAADYVDIALRKKMEHFSVSAYVKNVTNTTDGLPIGANGGLAFPYGRFFGARAEYAF